jgi:hypothetical protein
MCAAHPDAQQQRGEFDATAVNWVTLEGIDCAQEFAERRLNDDGRIVEVRLGSNQKNRCSSLEIPA